MTYMKATTNNFNCSALMEEVRAKVEQLKKYGMSERDIVSRLQGGHSLMPLTVTRSNRLFIGDNKKEVYMEPLLKAVYLLFLKHPEGIAFKDLPDYREELTKIYDRLRPLGINNRALQSIEDVTNPMLNSINEKCARIKKIFLCMMERDVAEHYYIKGTRGEPKRITLSRDLLVWE